MSENASDWEAGRTFRSVLVATWCVGCTLTSNVDELTGGAPKAGGSATIVSTHGSSTGVAGSQSADQASYGGAAAGGTSGAVAGASGTTETGRIGEAAGAEGSAGGGGAAGDERMGETAGEGGSAGSVGAAEAGGTGATGGTVGAGASTGGVGATGGEGADGAEAGSQGTGASAGAGTAGASAACSGELYMGVCWYLGEPGESCDQACADRGGYSPDATQYIGSLLQGGRVAFCTDILEALGHLGEVQAGRRSDGLGLGCHRWAGSDLWWLYWPAFGPADSDAEAERVCGCQQ